jgi:hypothetical protein
MSVYFCNKIVAWVKSVKFMNLTSEAATLIITICNLKKVRAVFARRWQEI